MRPRTVDWLTLLCWLAVCRLAVATTNCQWTQSANTYAGNGQVVKLLINTAEDCQNQCKDNCVAVMYESPFCRLFSDPPQAVTDPQSYNQVLYRKTCTTGLQPSDGQYSELKNIAMGKTVFSSSQAGPTFKPELAIDGPAGGCFMAANTDSQPFWGIDLGKVQEVKEIQITNRADCCADELNHFSIELFVSDPLKGNSGTPCITVTTAIGLGATGKYQCASASQSPSGRWLRIKKNAPKLTLCEVGIFVAGPQTGVASINCTFEEEDLYTDCNLYSAPSSAFQFTKGTHGSGPPSDHTTENGAKNGKYMYADLTEMQVGKKAALMSFEITSQYDCVTFWYYLTATEATKNVLVVQEAETSSLASPVTLWSSDGQDLTLWRRAQIQARGGSRRIIFIVEKIRGGFVAIDDLTISSEACPFRTKIYDAINCTFEDPSGNICDFGQPTTDARDWVWTNKPTPTPNTGPPPPTSYYMYSRGDSAMAVLVTPKLRATFPKSCLRFRLHRYKQASNSNLGNLYVKVLTNIDGSLQSTPAQWSTQQLANKNEWVPVEVSINTPPNAVIAFERQGGEADIAIDDVSVVNSECQSLTAFSCLFSSTICSYFAQYSNSAPWELRTSPPSSQLVGPSKGHTGDRYAFPAFKGPGNATEASLVTAPIETNVSQSCLTFWYAMGTDSELGTFEVRVSDPDLSNPRVVWSFSRGMSDELINHWTRAAVTLNTENPIRITFWVNDTYGNTTVGLDDAELSRDPCPSEKDVSTFSCNLDTDDLCGLGQISLGDHFDWAWYTGSTPTDHTGPDKDHTSGNGHYLYIEVSEPRQQSDNAILYTPTIVPTSPKSCLAFYFHMHGNETGSLAVYKDKYSTFSSASQRLWVQGRDQGKAWKKASIEMDTLEPYKLFFVGSVGQGGLGDIAIDDISIQDKDCQAYSAFSCSFEITICGFLQWHRDDFQWTHKRIERRSSGSGPSFSPHVAGSFMQVVVDGSQSPGDTAVLVSPLMTTLSTNDSCLTFWYHLHGQAVGELTLLTSDPGVKDNNTVWSASSETGDRWNRVAVTIQTFPPSRFLFMATVGKGRGDIAIDDVDINIGACPHDRLVDRFRCDFDKPEVCGLRNEHGTADSFDWLWHTGKTPTGSLPGVETGPQKDHTSGSGHYMYADASPPRSAGNTARLVSPYIWFFTARSCLSFWYSMSGSQVGRLRVSILTSEGLTIPVWTRTGHQGTGWIQATVELQKRALKFQLVLEGTVGTGPSGDIAIDDLELTNDPCPAVITESVNCTFSGGDTCGYKQPKRDGLVWTLTKGIGGSTSDAPSGDNTTGDGLFMYNKDYRPKTALVSPVLSWDVRENCLQFDYSMVGRTMGTLIVSLARARMLEERQPLLSTDNETSQQWVSASFDFEIHHPLQIIFEVVRGSGLYTDIAIDNVKVLPHKCSETAATCSFSSDLCQYTIISTTAPNSPPLWLRHRGETPTNDTGPLADHTNGKDGHYMYFEANATSVTNGSLLASGVINEASKSCLSFWYMMYGDDTGPFTVFLASAENSTAGRKDLWQRSTPTDRQWHYAEVDVDIQATSKVYFEATLGEGGGAKGNTAVDDIGLRSQPCGHTPLPESRADCNFDKSFCGYKHLYPVSYEHPVWKRLSGPTPTADTGPTEDYPAGYSGHYVYPGSAQLHNLNGASSSLESPPLTWTPQRICLRFAYHMQGAETGTLVVIKKEVASQKLDFLRTAKGDQGEGWKLAEIDNDITAPAFFLFLGVSVVTENLTVYSNIGLDNVQVTSGTCNPVAWTKGIDFQCDRPTTPCVGGQGKCNSTSQSCDCEEGFYGLQCQFSAVTGAQCQNSPCERGLCLNETVCVCPDQFYGDKCQHKMVQAECTLTKMVVNILPHGFTALASWNIRHPDTAGTSCKLKPAETVASVSNRGLQGFVGEFLHENDPCAGNATLEEETTDTKTFSRQLYVYYDPLGRHPTDSSVTVNCTVNVPKPPPLPEPRLSVTVKEVRPQIPPQLTPGGRIRTDLEIRFALTIPNKEDMTEIKVMQCTANNGVQTIYVVKRGCVLYPVGELLYDGGDVGSEYLIMQVYKLPKASLTVFFKCSVRLCDARFDFFCYQRALCFGRTKRSVSWEVEETMKGKNMVDVEYTHTLTD